ncbi:MAG: RDD family protein [Janthinobacterium lividum]
MEEYIYCSLKRRYFAYLIDQLIIGLLILLLIALLFVTIWIADLLSEDQLQPLLRGITPVLLMLIYPLYNILFICSSMSATPGKYYLGVKVIAISQPRIAFFRSASRCILIMLECYLVLPMIISTLMIIFTKQKIALHDIICKTRVIRRTSNNMNLTQNITIG